MDFALTEDLKALRDRVRDFVEREVIPLESRQDCIDEHRNIAPTHWSDSREGEGRGPLAPQMPQRLGGLGLGMVAMAVCYEEMNRSIFGPVCFNCARPTTGRCLRSRKCWPIRRRRKWLAAHCRRPCAVRVRHDRARSRGGSDPSMCSLAPNAWATSGSCMAASGSSRARPTRSTSF